ncbi:MAG: DNA-binding domain-containing protein [Cohaesibacter sp.]|jgi:hypothetical protein|nr:DNA-binding domain-containing protein [Cohaesibacter sp.]
MPDKSASPQTPPPLPAIPPLIADQQAFSEGLLVAERELPNDVIGPAKGKKALKRYNVYRNNVIVGLTEALMASYPTITELVGEEFFRAMAPAYIRTTPPKSGMLAQYGESFCDFLEGFEPVLDVPYLPDMARLEYAWLQSYHAQDIAPLDPAILQEIEQERLGELIFRFHPACQLLTSSHPIYSIWAAHKQDDPAAHMERITYQGENVLITRPDLDVSVISLPQGGETFIAALMDGKCLAEAAEYASEHSDSFDLAQNLGGLLEVGALRALHLPEPDISA